MEIRQWWRRSLCGLSGAITSTVKAFNLEGVPGTSREFTRGELYVVVQQIPPAVLMLVELLHKAENSVVVMQAVAKVFVSQMPSFVLQSPWSCCGALVRTATLFYHKSPEPTASQS